MPKRIISTSTNWPGSVTLADPLTLPQVEAIEQAVDFRPEPNADGNYWFTAFDRVRIPALILCMEKWELANFPESPTLDTWPLTPRKASSDLVTFLWGELLKVYNGEQEIPNE